VKDKDVTYLLFYDTKNEHIKEISMDFSKVLFTIHIPHICGETFTNKFRDVPFIMDEYTTEFLEL
jgi:hypothetical protein